jgi:titin
VDTPLVDIQGSPAIDPDGNIITGGSKIYSIYPNGTVKWAKDYNMESKTLTVDSDGNIFFCGKIPNNDNNYIVMLDKNGILKWKTPISNPSYPPVVMPNGELYISNKFQDTGEYVLQILGMTEQEPPRINPARSGDSFVNFTWFTPDHNGGEEIEEYRIYRKDSASEPYVHKFTVDPDVSWFEDDTVTNGILYSYQITAVSSIGESDPSDRVSATLLSTPSPPRNLAGVYGDNYVFLEWETPLDDGGTEITQLTLYKGPDEGSLEPIMNLSTTRSNYNDSEVNPGNNYFYAISCFNSEGESDLSNIVSGVPKTLPLTPLDFSYNTGNGFVQLSWAPPSFDGGSPIINYTVYKGIFTIGYIFPNTILDQTNLEFNDTDVENGVHYIYSLKTSTLIGDSQRTEELMATPTGPPLPPVNLSCTSGDGFVEITWEQPESDGGISVTGYSIEKKEGPNTRLIDLNGMTLIYRDNDVTNGDQYSYRIRSINPAGDSSFTESIDCIPLGKPSTPLNLEYKVRRYFSLVSWSPPEDNGGSPITSYRLFRNGSLISELSATITTYNDTEVAPGINYHYSVSAVNSEGESIKSDSITIGIPEIPEVSTSPPSAPMDLSFTVSNLSVTMSWSEPESDGNSSVIEYNIYRTYLGKEEMIESISSSSLTYTDNSVIAGGSYKYHVSARNGVGEGPASNEISVTIDEKEENNDNEKSNLIWFILIPGILAIILIVIFVAIITRKKGQEEEEPEIEEQREEGYDFNNL